MITLAWATVALHGRTRALELLAEVRTLTDSPRITALSLVQESVVHVATSEWRPALVALAQVEADMELLTPREQTSALLNAGLSHLSLLELDAARGELERALGIATTHGIREQEFKARHNLGCLAYYAGQLPEAIRLMREADDVDAPVSRARAKHDLALCLLEAGLLDQAHVTLRAALGEARSSHLRIEQGDIHVDLARCAMLRDDLTQARRQLSDAGRAFRAREATGRRQHAALLRASLDLAAGRQPRALSTVLEPFATGRPVTPDDRLATRVRVEALLQRGDHQGAAYAVRRLRGQPHQGIEGDMHDRLLFARVAAAQGNSSAAGRIVRDALRQLTTRQAPSQSLEVRSALALHGRQLGDFDLGRALSTGSPRRIFDSVERWRALSHRLPPVSTAADDAVADLVAELRYTRHLLRAGEGGASAADEATGASGALTHDTRLRERIAALEWQITHHDLTTRDTADDTAYGAGASGGTAAGAAATLATTVELLRSRGEDGIFLFGHGGRQYVLHASRRSRVVEVGTLDRVAAAAAQLRRDLRAQAVAFHHPVLAATLDRAVTHSAAALDRLLFTEVEVPPGHGAVVVPSRALTSVPWSLLPSLSGRPVTVSTSATRWATAVSAKVPQDEPWAVTALCGPGLARAGREVEAVAGAWLTTAAPAGSPAMSTATHLSSARSADVRAALSTPGVVHVAAHGSHEAQSPFFSSLHMADGPVFAHELPRPVASQHVVLSACDVGQSEVRPGDEPLGLTAALISLGVQSVVAPVAPVQDVVAERVMVGYHSRLAAGTSASLALAEAIAENPGAGAFCLFGADWRQPTGPQPTGPQPS